MISSLARHIPQACAALKNGVWDRKTYMGSELHGKTLAILGLGRIGREVAVRMQAFGMKTIGYDPVTSREAAAQFNVDKMELDAIWPLADYISVHTPYMAQTHHLINGQTLAKCKRGVRVVNIARGGIVDEEALLHSLEAGVCHGAAFDVFAEEPPKMDSVSGRLIQHPLVVCTPHLGASTVEAQQRVAREMAEQLIDLIEGRQAVGVANAPVLARSMIDSNKPWMQLSQALGHLAHRLAVNATGSSSGSSGASTAADVSVELIGYGPATEDVNLLASSALVGHLNGMTSNGVNIVNSLLLARDRGIRCTARHFAAVPAHLLPAVPAAICSHLERMLQLTVNIGSSVSVSLVGSVQAGSAVLFAINDSWFPLGATLSGNVLLFSGKRPDSTLVASIGNQQKKTTHHAIFHQFHSILLSHL